ncbi:MAG: IspD/TarI family cytidylyltransferase [Phycisphaerales bacterium]
MDSKHMRVCCIIAAAGASSRYSVGGGLRNKLDEDLGGKPVLQRTVEIFAKFESSEATIPSIVVAGPYPDDAFQEFRERHGDRLGLLGARLCRGGEAHRWQTVAAALALVPEDCTHVAVHDAARPCLTLDLLNRLFDAAAKFPAVIPAIPLSDTIKRVEETGEKFGGDDVAAAILGITESAKHPLRVVTQTPDRAGLMLIQTPQVFEVGLLRRAYAQADLTSTDDATLVERLGERVVVVDGEARNIKITRPADIDLARAILGARPPEGRATHKKF